MIKTLNSLDKGGNVVNLTSATTDYPLAIGETATITYTSATSVPLHVATVEGLYEVKLYNSNSIPTSPINGDVFLNPNNTTYSGVFKRQEMYGANNVSTVLQQNTTTDSAFALAYAHLITVDGIICTSTNNKHFSGKHARVHNNNVIYHMFATSLWTDSTVWVSLGTITFPFAQSGKIVIRRIA